MTVDEERKMWKRSYLQEKEKVRLLMEGLNALRKASRECDRVQVLEVE